MGIGNNQATVHCEESVAWALGPLLRLVGRGGKTRRQAVCGSLTVTPEGSMLLAIQPQHKEAPMIRVMKATAPKGTRLHAAAKTPCTHSRLIDDVLTTTGTKTGQLICLECTAVFPDPTFEKAAS